MARRNTHQTNETGSVRQVVPPNGRRTPARAGGSRDPRGPGVRTGRARRRIDLRPNRASLCADAVDLQVYWPWARALRSHEAQKSDSKTWLQASRVMIWCAVCRLSPMYVPALWCYVVRHSEYKHTGHGNRKSKGHAWRGNINDNGIINVIGNSSGSGGSSAM